MLVCVRNVKKAPPDKYGNEDAKLAAYRVLARIIQFRNCTSIHVKRVKGVLRDATNKRYFLFSSFFFPFFPSTVSPLHDLFLKCFDSSCVYSGVRVLPKFVRVADEKKYKHVFRVCLRNIFFSRILKNLEHTLCVVSLQLGIIIGEKYSR